MKAPELYYYKVKVVKIVDGDTIDVMVDYGFKACQEHRLRLADLDAPEVRGAEREDGLEIKRKLINVCGAGTTLLMKSSKKGKYGRLIADLWYWPLAGDDIPDESINDLIRKWVKEQEDAKLQGSVDVEETTTEVSKD